MNNLKRQGNSLQDIAAALDDLFPLTNPSPLEHQATTQRKAGQRDVVEYVQRLLMEEDNLKIF